jgi:predicted Zn-dependent protease
MQQRVESIGEALIPAYQGDLPDNDPSKINFRFQVVDQPKLRDALTLSNGIILVPQQVVDRLKNDSQLATVLADNIACALEKQQLRQIPAGRAMTAGDVALIVGGAFVPGLGFAGPAGMMAGGAVMIRRAEEQSGRVSLVLLHRAGYDLAEAPITWWILGSSKEKPLEKTGMPARAKYLYRILDTTWRHPELDSLAPTMAAR